jgi:protein-tyrosine-phosphatase
MTETILFLCPHHAAKSVIAEVYFNRLAQQYNLPLRGDSAGTDPEATVSPAVAELLRNEGLDVSGHHPRLVTKDELAQALRIISMGCTAEELGVPAERVEQWVDVPMVSQNILGARDAIRAHVESLVAQLRDVSVAE